MKQILIALLSQGVLLAVCHAQNVTGRIVIEGHYDRFTTDELGNTYVLRGDELELYDKHGKSWLRNSGKTFGRIHTIDAFYSLKPMVFSPELGQIAVLDNTLSVQGSVLNLPRNGFPQVRLACMSVQNHFWLFDERDLSVIRVDAHLRSRANSGRLDQQLGVTPGPSSMQEHENWLYMNDPDLGILVFDLFGTYSRTIPILGASHFEVRGKMLYFLAEGKFQVYDMRTFEILPFPIPLEEEGELLNARVEMNRVYLHLPERIVILEFQR